MAYMPYLLKPFMCLINLFYHSLQHGYWAPSLYKKPLNQALPLAVLSLGTLNQRTVGCSALGPSYITKLALNIKTTSFFFVSCVLYFFLPVLLIIVVFNSFLIIAFLATCTLRIILGPFWPHFLVTPTHIWESYLLYYKNICQKCSYKKRSMLMI